MATIQARKWSVDLGRIMVSSCLNHFKLETQSGVFSSAIGIILTSVEFEWVGRCGRCIEAFYEISPVMTQILGPATWISCEYLSKY
jgi:hypothetical protein